MLRVLQWAIALVCAAPAVSGVQALVKDGRALPWTINALIGGVSLLHLSAAYGLLRWRRWGRWLAVPAAAIFFLGAWASFFEDEEMLMGSLFAAGGIGIAAWLLAPPVRRRFALEKAPA